MGTYLKACSPQKFAWNGIKFLAVLHRTGGVIGDHLVLRMGRRGQFARGKKFRYVLGERGNPRSPFRKGLVIPQQLSVILDHRAAARRRDHNRIEPVALDFRAPDVDLARAWVAAA